MLLLLACTAPKDEPTDDTASAVDDTAADDTATGDSSAHFSEVTITSAPDIPAVQLVRFVTDLEGDGWVRFGPPGEDNRTVAATAADGGWEATLVGLPPDSAGEVTVGVGEVEGPMTEITTGAGPDWLTMDSASGTPTPGFLVLGVENGGGPTGAVILDTQGRPVWWSQAPEDLYGHLHTRARLAPDGQHVTYIAFGFPEPGSSDDGRTELISVSLDGSVVERIDFGDAHHDYLYLPDGGMAWIDVEDQEFDGRTLRAETIVERDPKGVERVVWSAWDTFTPEPGEIGAPEGWWTLGNHLEYEPETDTYTISLRNLDTLVHVDRGTGEVLWTVGKYGEIVPDTQFDGQHGFDVLGDTLLVFDNAASSSQSRVVRYTLDTTAKTATATWIYDDSGLTSFVMGDAHTLENGNVEVMFSTSSTWQELDTDGEVIATFAAAMTTTLGFVERWDQIGE